MRLDRAQRPTCLAGDLLEAQLAEEPKRDDLSIWLVQAADRRADPRGPFGMERGDRRVLATGQIDAGRGIARVDPGDVSPALGTAERDPDGDPRQPRAERTVATPGGETPECDHECLLGGILGLVEIAQDAMAGSQDGRALALDEESERLTVAGQDGIDSGAFIGDLRSGWPERRLVTVA